ncbi:FecR domain-containing protein [Sphingomonas sp.]|uniref:FecR family protein n=1 Tax=Sphingomonas sp. TaxID=28214 RepID=UPI0025EAA03F|nr:FecR domain-containing protein [Sphingomonas sp.]
MFVARWQDVRRRRAAQAWVVRLDAGALSSRRERALQHWVATPANADALRKAARFWEGMDDILLAQRLRSTRPAAQWRGTPSLRMKVVLLGGVLIVALGGLSQTDFLIALRADARTDTGETRLVTLEDGSRVLLDSHSAVDIAYTRGERRVRLLEGRARFDVAPAPDRPFLVQAGDGVTRALGTTFSVDADGAATLVSAIRHDIRVSLGNKAQILHPGQSLRYAGQLGSPEVSDASVDAWTRGMVVFDNARLADVAASLQRYSDRRILIWGAARDRRFSGVIKSADPLGGLAAIAKSDGLELRLLPWLAVVTAR